MKTNYTVTVRRLTAPDEWIEAIKSTIGGKSIGKGTTWRRMLNAGHSPIRSQLYRIVMDGIPSFVSVHFARHKIGCEHYVQSMRDDRGGGDDVGRMTPVLHTMDVNAQAMMTIARARLCFQSHELTREVMQYILIELAKIDNDLASMCVPMCEYRGGKCPELRPCKRVVKIY